MNFVKIAQNHSFTKMRINIQHASNLCVIYQHYPCDMYINLHAIGLTGVTKIRYSYISFLRQIGVDFTGRFLGGYCCVESIFLLKV